MSELESAWNEPRDNVSSVVKTANVRFLHRSILWCRSESPERLSATGFSCPFHDRLKVNIFVNIFIWLKSPRSLAAVEEDYH